VTRCHGHDLGGPVSHVCTDLCTYNACCKGDSVTPPGYGFKVVPVDDGFLVVDAYTNVTVADAPTRREAWGVVTRLSNERVTAPRCDCGNGLKPDDVDGECEWCASGECDVLVFVDGPPAGEKVGDCVNGEPVFRSHFAGTIYHASGATCWSPS
jgi:hypothetical protein